MENEKTTDQERDEGILVWQGPEHVVMHRGADWFLIVGIAGVALAVSALIFGNVLFGILIIVSAFALVLFAVREPKTVTFSLTPQGLVVDDKKYPFSILESFWVSEPENGHDEGARLIFQSDKLFVHHLTIPLENISADEVREYLAHHLPEEEVYEPLSHQIMEYLGF
jgi:hypothetical protein